MVWADLHDGFKVAVAVGRIHDILRPNPNLGKFVTALPIHRMRRRGSCKKQKNIHIKYLANIVTHTWGSQNEAQILTWGADMQDTDQSGKWDGEQNIHGVSTGFWLVRTVFGVFGAALCWSPDLCSALYAWTLSPSSALPRSSLLPFLLFSLLSFTEVACRVLQTVLL